MIKTRSYTSNKYAINSVDQHISYVREEFENVVNQTHINYRSS